MSRKVSGTAGSFGAPKPLPGQPGYKATETDLLQKDTQDMEARLSTLQERMKQQDAVAAQSAGKAGAGATWGSARKDKGSVSSYGKEIKEKVKKQLETTVPRESLLRNTASTRRMMQTNDGDFKSKGVADWTVGDVSSWLAELQLKEYVSAFAQNAINGSVLLDITNEDLDYMEIKALGHRKVIMRGVEDLRKTGSYSASPSNVAPPILRTASNPNIADERQLHSKSMQFESTSGSGPQKDSEAKTMHWSQLEPLANKKVSNPKGGAFVNAADEGDMLDEAAERQAFMDAVAEWRKADAGDDGARKPVTIEREYQNGGKAAGKSSDGAGAGSLAQSGGQSEMWKNPFAPSQEVFDDHVESDVLDEAAERRAFQAAVMEWRRGPAEAPAASSDLPLKSATRAGSHTATNEAKESTVGPSAGSGGGAAGLDGTLDEAREHAEFVKAVESWRKRDEDGPGAPTATSTAQSVADRLAKDLEAERQASSLKLKQQREDAERRLREANLELTKLRSARDLKKAADHDVDEHQDGDVDAAVDDDDEDPTVYTYSSAPKSHGDSLSARAGRMQLDTAPRVTSGSAEPSPKRTARQWSEADYEVAGTGSNVKLALVESTIGEGKNADEGDYYVEEADSDED